LDVQILYLRAKTTYYTPHNQPEMTITITRDEFLSDRQGRTFADVVNDSQQPFGEALAFFNHSDRQRRLEESETHHDRAPLAGVVRELEASPGINKFLGKVHARRSQRFRQAIGVLIRILMERSGWRKTGKKGSLGVRSPAAAGRPRHNTGGLAFWFLRAERYERKEGKPFVSVRERCRELESKPPQKKSRPSKTATRSKRASKGASTQTG
jgi:hypothetical protein